jgi:DNA-binding XRE family transcriptional regulator
MIRTNAEYRDAQERLRRDRAFIAAQREKLGEMDLSPEEIQRAIEPALSFHEQLQEEVEAYERLVRGDTTVIESLAEIGRVLIGLRIAQQLSQAELARRLGVSESQVSRDERNDYHGITVERAQRIIAALGGRIRLEATPQVEQDDLVMA